MKDAPPEARASDALEGADDLVRHALSIVPDLSVVVVDANLRYRSVYGTAMTRHGLDPAVLLGNRAPEVLPPQAWRLVAPLYRRALNGELVSTIITSADGATDYTTSMTPIRDDDDVVVGCVVMHRDATAERSALSALSASERLHAMVAENTGDVFAWLDLDGRYTYLSGSAERVYGWDVAGTIGCRSLDLVHPDDRERVESRHCSIRSGGEHAAAQYRVHRSDGTWNWVETTFRPAFDDSGTLIGVQVTEHDLTERRFREAELAQARDLFEVAFNSAPIGMALVAPNGRWLRVNRSLCDLLGYDPDQLLRSTYQEITHPEDLATCLAMLDTLIDGRTDDFRLEKRYVHADGHPVWALVAVTLVRNEDGSPRWFITQVADIAARRAIEAELQYQAHHDSLTGLWNRARLHMELLSCLDRARATRAPATLLLIDLDGFKGVNDRYGHEIGDQKLQVVAAAVAGALREGDCAARLGGDEFVVVLPDTTLDMAQAVARRVVDVVARVGGHADIRASVGIAAAGQHLDPNSWLRSADRAMYDAKRAGGGRSATAPPPVADPLASGP